MESNIILTKHDMSWWKDVEPVAEELVFGESRPHGFSRANFVLVTRQRQDEKLIGYVTMLEMDQDTIYWQHGGSFPGFRGSILTFRAYEEVRNWCEAQGYKQALTFIHQDNPPMLKMAMRLGFRINGVKYFEGQVFVGLELKLRKGN